MSLGVAFLAGAFIFGEKQAQEKAMSLGSAFLAGAFVYLEKHVQKKLCLSGRRSKQGLLFS